MTVIQTLKAQVRHAVSRHPFSRHAWNFDRDALFAAAGGVKVWEDLQPGVKYLGNMHELQAVADPLVLRCYTLGQRYLRFAYYMKETRHQWKAVNHVHYADNSVEAVEVSALTGATRQRMTVAPHGDACF